jgi:MoaA/NifB/PqqE/SkfB family radical SAM enzyme
MTEQRQITRRGLSAGELAQKIDGRKVYVWGAGRTGRALLHALRRNGFSVESFLDKNPYYENIIYNAVQTISPDVFFNDAPRYKNAFVIIAGGTYKVKKEMAAILKENGANFIDINDVAPFHPSVDIAGFCNLRCIACPVGDISRKHEKGGLMSAETFEKVLEKLLVEIPFLLEVSLYLWGDPLLNPALPDIIRLCSTRGVLPVVSTNLNYGKYLEDLIKANPPEILVSTSGYGPQNYETTHLGGKWDLFYNNLLKLREYIDKYKASTIPIVYLHANKINLGDYKPLYELCQKLSFRLRVEPSIVFPDIALDYVEGKALSDNAKKAIDIQFAGMEELLEYARNRHKLKCSNSYAMPNVAWDLSVFPCSNYRLKSPFNFLETPLGDLIDDCNNSALCEKCVEHSLHRYRALPEFEEEIREKIFAMHQLPDRL